MRLSVEASLIYFYLLLLKTNCCFNSQVGFFVNKKGWGYLENTSNELAAMKLIANSGDGRSFAFAGLKKAKEGKFDEAALLLEKSDDAIRVAHNVQTKLLVAEASGIKQELGLLMVHAQDHFMTSLLANELIKEMIIFCKHSRELK